MIFLYINHWTVVCIKRTKRLQAPIGCVTWGCYINSDRTDRGAVVRTWDTRWQHSLIHTTKQLRFGLVICQRQWMLKKYTHTNTQTSYCKSTVEMLRVFFFSNYIIQLYIYTYRNYLFFFSKPSKTKISPQSARRGKCMGPAICNHTTNHAITHQ